MDSPATASDVRFSTKVALWFLDTVKRQRKCDRYARDDQDGRLGIKGAPVDIDDPDGPWSIGVAGLKKCGYWHCPTCGGRIAVSRAAEDAHMLRIWHELGHEVILATFTARHHKGTDLRKLVRGMRKAWRHATQGRAWRMIKSDLGITWRIRVFECNHGDEHGWHPHYHVLFFIEEWPYEERSPEAVREVLGDVWARWVTGLRKEGFDAVDEVDGKTAGFDARLLDLGDPQAVAVATGDYFYKHALNTIQQRAAMTAEQKAAGAALEADGGIFKVGKGEGAPVGERHRSMAQVMEDYALNSSIRVWSREEKALLSPDKRQMKAEERSKLAAEDGRLICTFQEVMVSEKVSQRDPSRGMRAWFAEQARELGIPGPLLDGEERTDEEIAEDEVAGAVVATFDADAWTARGEVARFGGDERRMVGLAFEYAQMKAAARRNWPTFERFMRARPWTGFRLAGDDDDGGGGGPDG